MAQKAQTPPLHLTIKDLAYFLDVQAKNRRQDSSIAQQTNN